LWSTDNILYSDSDDLKLRRTLQTCQGVCEMEDGDLNLASTQISSDAGKTSYERHIDLVNKKLRVKRLNVIINYNIAAEVPEGQEASLVQNWSTGTRY